MLTRDRPFVLLDDARADGAARLYRDPVETIVARTTGAIAGCLARLRAAGAEGLHAAGYLAYEAGPLGERVATAEDGTGGGADGHGDADGRPLLWFGLFGRFEHVDAAALLPDAAGAWASPPQPLVARADYLAAFARVKAYLAAGDIYQANLTFPATCRIAGDPLALYARIRRHAAAGWGGIVHDGLGRTLLSFSPELFFRLDGGRLTARPMKGTARREADAAADRAAAAALASDAKQRAENLMIVDLLRNDLSRVAVAGSVAVPALFEVETYPTVHQMTSTVEAVLAPGADAVAVLEASFPCGSITGAPKLRAMAIAAALEQGPRGIYTGAIGRIDAGGDAAFNVAIRTLEVTGEAAGGAAGSRATIGLGSGVVADSRGADEWRECLAKGAFVSAGCAPFDLIETMRFDPVEGMPDLERHLARIKASADALGHAFDRHDARNELQAATFRLKAPARVRLCAAPGGRIAVEVRPMPAPRTAPAIAALVPLPVDPGDFRLRHKTSARGFYDDARRAAGTDEVVFVRRDGLVTEGSFTSLFVRRGDGMLLTPPLALGLLPGVLRARLIEEGAAIEAEIPAERLRDGFLLGNALRGLFVARLPG